MTFHTYGVVLASFGGAWDGGLLAAYLDRCLGRGGLGYEQLTVMGAPRTPTLPCTAAGQPAFCRGVV